MQQFETIMGKMREIQFKKLVAELYDFDDSNFGLRMDDLLFLKDSPLLHAHNREGVEMNELYLEITMYKDEINKKADA
jgi:hypothetical protein